MTICVLWPEEIEQAWYVSDYIDHSDMYLFRGKNKRIRSHTDEKSSLKIARKSLEDISDDELLSTLVYALSIDLCVSPTNLCQFITYILFLRS